MIVGPFEINWPREDPESVRHTILKRYNAEVHSQSAIEALPELWAESGLTGVDVERIELDTFQDLEKLTFDAADPEVFGCHMSDTCAPGGAYPERMKMLSTAKVDVGSARHATTSV